MIPIILEGPDGSGKSTLATYLSPYFSMPIIRGEGPEKYPGEMNERAERWLARHHQGVIFDRHPCISHPIYSQFTPVQKVDPKIVQRFYAMPSIKVYCRAPGEFAQVDKDYDTAAHVRAISTNHERICKLYDEWALGRADIIYNMRHTAMEKILAFIKGAI